MEKIALGVPYEISIEPSIDIGEFDAEIVLKLKDHRIGVELKKIKGEDISYSFIIPSEFANTFKKKTVDYGIFVYKENARFEVDDGKISFIDKEDFKVKTTDKTKMRPVKDEEKPEEPVSKKKKDDKTTPEPSKTAPDAVKERVFNPEEFAQSLIEKQAAQKFEGVQPEVGKASPVPTPLPSRAPTVRPDPSAGNLHAILNTIESQKAKDARRKKINENIRRGLKDKD